MQTVSNIVIKTHNAASTKTGQVATKAIDATKPTKIATQRDFTYELVDTTTNTAPKNIHTLRKGDDLWVSFDNGKTADLVLENYFETQATLVGVGENGTFYQYFADNVLLNDLANHTATIQTLGANPSSLPWWTTAASAKAGIGATALLGTLGGVGAVAMAVKKSADNDQPSSRISQKTVNDTADGTIKSDTSVTSSDTQSPAIQDLSAQTLPTDSVASTAITPINSSSNSNQLANNGQPSTNPVSPTVKPTQSTDTKSPGSNVSNTQQPPKNQEPSADNQSANTSIKPTTSTATLPTQSTDNTKDKSDNTFDKDVPPANTQKPTDDSSKDSNNKDSTKTDNEPPKNTDQKGELNDKQSDGKSSSDNTNNNKQPSEDTTATDVAVPPTVTQNPQEPQSNSEQTSNQATPVTSTGETDNAVDTGKLLADKEQSAENKEPSDKQSDTVTPKDESVTPPKDDLANTDDESKNTDESSDKQPPQNTKDDAQKPADTLLSPVADTQSPADDASKTSPVTANPTADTGITDPADTQSPDSEKLPTSEQSSDKTDSSQPSKDENKADKPVSPVDTKNPVDAVATQNPSDDKSKETVNPVTNTDTDDSVDTQKPSDTKQSPNDKGSEDTATPSKDLADNEPSKNTDKKGESDGKQPSEDLKSEDLKNDEQPPQTATDVAVPPSVTQPQEPQENSSQDQSSSDQAASPVTSTGETDNAVDTGKSPTDKEQSNTDDESENTDAKTEQESGDKKPSETTTIAPPTDVVIPPTDEQNPNIEVPPKDPETDVRPQPVFIELNSITGDNRINAVEVKESITVAGKVTGGNVQKGQHINIKVGDYTQSVELQDGLTFKTQINGKHFKSLNNDKYQVSASIEDKTEVKSYTFDDNALVGVQITSVDKTFDTVRLEGQVELSGDFAKGLNPHRLKALDITIGDKTYQAGINEETQKFFVDVAVSDLKKADGTQVAYKFYHDDKLLTFTPKPNNGMTIYDSKTGLKLTHDVDVIDAPELTSVNVSWQGDVIKNSTVNSDSIPESGLVIKGQVLQTVKESDSVKISIGGVEKDAVINKNGEFILTTDAPAQPTTIKATLTSALNGKTLTTQDSHAYAPAKTENTEFVEKSGKVPYEDLPKPIQILETNQFSDEVKNIKFGERFAEYPYGGKDETLNLQYYFKKESDFRPTQVKFYQPVEMSATEKSVVKSVLAKIQEYTNITFTETDQWKLGKHNTLTYSKRNILPGSALDAEGENQGLDVLLSKKHFKEGGKSLDSLTGYLTTAHETLHALGMGHPHTEPGRDKLKEFYPSNIESKGITVMSYDNAEDFVKTRDLRILDLAYLQYRYGVNKNSRATDDTYGFKTVNAAKADLDVYIWDGAGNDTFDASQEQKGVYVNLTGGSFIYADKDKRPIDQIEFPVKGNFGVNGEINSYFEKDLQKGERIAQDVKKAHTIALPDFIEGVSFIGYNTQLENLIGSKSDDILIGNRANNVIFGGAGNDDISGGEGNDDLDGGTGDDTLTGGAGNDIYRVDSQNDKIVETDNVGVDTVYSTAVEYTLLQNVENLYLLGEAESGTGNAGNNTIVGNSAVNTLTGGGGADSFVFNTPFNGNVDKITDFKADDKLILAKHLFEDMTDVNTLFDNHIVYDENTKTVSYDADGIGSGNDAVAFVVLENFDGALTVANFGIIDSII